jgi:hypothetical protein
LRAHPFDRLSHFPSRRAHPERERRRPAIIPNGGSAVPCRSRGIRSPRQSFSEMVCWKMDCLSRAARRRLATTTDSSSSTTLSRRSTSATVRDCSGRRRRRAATILVVEPVARWPLCGPREYPEGTTVDQPGVRRTVTHRPARESFGSRLRC